MTQIITTAVKNKIQKGLSYPFGAELISKKLEGIPQFDEIELCFYAREGNPLGYYVPDESFIKLKGAKIHNSKLRSFKEIMIARWWDDYWSIAIFGIDSKSRNSAKFCLSALALPEIRLWLSEFHEDAWFDGKKRLYIGIAESLEEVAIIEIHNNQLVKVKYLNVSSEN